MVNFIALLGWSPGGDREKFTMAEMVEAFSVERIGKTNAKFDRDKLLAFNTDAIAAAWPRTGCWRRLRITCALNQTAIPAGDAELLRRLLRATQGFRTFADIVDQVRRASIRPTTPIAYDAKAVEKVLDKGGDAGFAVLAELRPRAGGGRLDGGGAGQAARTASAKPRSSAWARSPSRIRVAVTGTTISPAIHETLLLLGQAKTLARIDRCLAMRRG